MATRVILDTDIGTDVDDCLALALILSSPELVLDRVTCVYGDVALRSRIVRELLRLHGSEEVPVFQGASRPLLGLRPVYWAGHEGDGLLEHAAARPAPKVPHAALELVRAVTEYPGEIHVVAIGPLTNVALAFLVEPELPRLIAHLTIMGGAARVAGGASLPHAEHNIKSDPEAAHIVLSSGAPITLVPLDVTTKTRIDRDGVARIRSGGGHFREAVADQLERYPRFAERGWTFLHDPLAAATVIRPDFVSTAPMHVDVELGGLHSAGATLVREPGAGDVNAAVALEVEAGRFEAFLLGRLAGSG